MTRPAAPLRAPRAGRPARRRPRPAGGHRHCRRAIAPRRRDSRSTALAGRTARPRSVSSDRCRPRPARGRPGPRRPSRRAPRDPPARSARRVRRTSRRIADSPRTVASRRPDGSAATIRLRASGSSQLRSTSPVPGYLEADRAVEVHRGDRRAVGQPGDRLHRGRLLDHRRAIVGVRRRPELDRPVVAAGGQREAGLCAFAFALAGIGRPGDGAHDVPVAAPDLQRPPLDRIPQRHGPVGAAGGQAGAVGAPRPGRSGPCSSAIE